MGYGIDTKGYRLYDPSRKRIIYSRDVVFNESDNAAEEEPELVDGGSSLRVDTDWSHESEVPDTENSEEETVIQTQDEEDSTTAVLRRSDRPRRRPDYYGTWVNTIVSEPQEPTTVMEALTGPNKEEWKTAMDKELESIERNKVWNLEELPEGKRAIGTKWVFKRKLNADGEVERYKARLVALGYSQRQGADYDETFSPVVRFESIRMLLALSVQHGFQLHQMDIASAFLNGDLKEEVYLSPPEGMVSEGQGRQVYKLQKSLYGLRQSPRCWNSTLDTRLKELGFKQTPSDPCIYTTLEGGPLFLAVYVDDIIIAGKEKEQIERVKDSLAQHFEVKDLGVLNHFLGVKVVCNQETGSVWIGQDVYVERLVEKFGMENAKPANTPVSSCCRLKKRDEEEERVDQTLYQSAVGGLLYLSARTRPDISYAVGNVAKYCNDPSKEHWVAVKRIFRYLKGNTRLGLLYTRSDQKEVIGYSDADWGGDNDDHRSTSGYIFQIGGTAISWSSRKQSCVALSTAEAEYMALSGATQEVMWLRQLYSDLLKPLTKPTILYEDNQSCISMAMNPKFHGRAKHINIRYHYVREQVGKSIDLNYCPTSDMVADVFTKGLSQEKFTNLRTRCGLNYPS